VPLKPKAKAVGWSPHRYRREEFPETGLYLPDHRAMGIIRGSIDLGSFHHPTASRTDEIQVEEWPRQARCAPVAVQQVALAQVYAGARETEGHGPRLDHGFIRNILVGVPPGIIS
jgi:hypothetical protein